MKIGVIGYSAQKFNEAKAKELIFQGMESMGFQDTDSIVSGLTNIGIPKIAYQLAKEHNLETVGIACKLATDYECYPVDKKIIIGSNWGDESRTFLNYIDVLIKVGGGKQSEEEYSKFRGEKVEYDLPSSKLREHLEE